MNNQENIHESPSSAQSEQSQQSQQGSVQTPYAKYPWVPPQWRHHLSQAKSQNAANASESPQAPQPLSQPKTSTNIPSSVLPPHAPHFSTTPGDLHTLAASTTPTTSGPEYPMFPRRRIPRSVSSKANWLEYVSNLPWLLNSEIPKEDRTCPFCWGEFGMALVYEDVAEAEAMASSDSEDEDEQDDEDEEADISEFFELTLAVNGGLASAISAGQGLHVTNPDPLSPVCESEEEDEEMEDLQLTQLLESQKSMLRQLRREMGVVEEEKEQRKVGKKHYAVKLPCGHLYGHMCLVEMLESGENTCPKCRKDNVEGKVKAP